MNSTQKHLLFLFAFASFSITHCADKPPRTPRYKSGATILEEARQIVHRGSSASKNSPRPGTPLKSPKKTKPQNLTPPNLEAHLHLPASQQPPRSPLITGQACIVILEDAPAPTTPQPAGALAAQSSAATATYSEPEPTTLVGKIKAACEAQRKQTMSAPSPKKKYLSCEANALHQQYLKPVDFMRQNQENPEALECFLESRQHFYVMHLALLGLPLPPFRLQKKD